MATLGTTDPVDETIMLICALGDTHGLIDRLYTTIFEFENTLGIQSRNICTCGVDSNRWSTLSVRLGARMMPTVTSQISS